MLHRTVHPHSVHSYLSKLNLFESSEHTTPRHLKNQRISTLLFLVLFVNLLVILTFYTAFSTVTNTVTLKNPSLFIYNTLSLQYPQTLLCRCSQIAIPYGNFLSYDPEYHQVCQSDLISDRFIKYLEFKNEEYVYYRDIRTIGSSPFQSLSSLCRLSHEMVQQELLTFNSTLFISLYTLPQNIFHSQVDASTALFKETTINAFLSTLILNRNITQINAIMSALQTNQAIQLYTEPSVDGFVNYYSYYFKYGNDNCSCQSSATCKAEIGFYHYLNSTKTLQFTIPNFYIGCYVLEALLQSDLSCFYNVSCFNEFQRHLLTNSSSQLTQFTSLNSSFASRYNETTTIIELMEQLMVEDWNIEVNYGAYFESCEPLSCTYSFTSRNSILYIITTVFGLIGGVATVLFFLVPFIVASVRREKEQLAGGESEQETSSEFRLRWEDLSL